VRVEQLGTGEPAVAVVGGIHGDEPCGPHAIEQLLADPPAVERPVKLVVANELAIERDVRYVDEDLNRTFPGDLDADTHEGRLAARLDAELGDCQTLALHSTQSYERLFALVDRLGEFERRICPQLSVDAVVETHDPDDGRVFSSVPAAIEVECGYQRSAAAADNAVRVTREFLLATGVIDPGEPPATTEVPVFRLGQPIPKEQADAYEVFARNFEEVAAGEAFAAMDGESVVADEPFHPVLLSPEGYRDIFGYRATLSGTIS
jgi:predicted deacylase